MIIIINDFISVTCTNYMARPTLWPTHSYKGTSSQGIVKQIMSFLLISLFSKPIKKAVFHHFLVFVCSMHKVELWHKSECIDPT